MSQCNPQSTFSAHRAPGREHIPIFPRGFIVVRLLQSLLALVAVGLTGYGVSILRFGGNDFVLAMGILTLLSNAYVCGSELFLPAVYNYWAVLSLDIFFMLMWLIAFSVLAAMVAAGAAVTGALDSYISYSSSLYDDGDYYLDTGAEAKTKLFMDTQGAAAAFGGFEFILYVLCLVFTSVMIYRHRFNGLHSVRRHPGARLGVQAGVGFAGEKHELRPQVPPPIAQPVVSV